jgi:hypothetical protein
LTNVHRLPGESRLADVLRSLRIAAAVFFAIGCLATCALWVRSYWWSDDLALALPGSRAVVIHSLQGATAWYVATGRERPRYWTLESEQAEAVTEGIDVPWLANLLSVHLIRQGIVIPHLFVALLCALAVVPCFKWRFGLRSLLLAATLLSVLIGVSAINSR